MLAVGHSLAADRIERIGRAAQEHRIVVLVGHTVDLDHTAVDRIADSDRIVGRIVVHIADQVVDQTAGRIVGRIGFDCSLRRILTLLRTKMCDLNQKIVDG